MAKLYFKYGAMGSSKTANALITQFNYEERGMKVWLIKPSIDVRDGADVVRSRIGLQASADIVTPDKNLFDEYQNHLDCHVIIADECQFFLAEQIDQLRDIVDKLHIPVLCYGLRTDFRTHLFEGSRRLFETADIVLDNGGVPGDASLAMADGMAVGPTSTAVGAAMLQAIACRVKEISLCEGWEAEFFKSSNIDGGDEYNAALLEKYGSMIPGLGGTEK